MEQLRFKFTDNTDSDDYYEMYCATCCVERKDTVRFYRDPGLTKMFGSDKRLGYYCSGGCGHVHFISNMTIYSGIKSGLIYTLYVLWHPAEVLVWQWNTDFFEGGDIWYPVDREAFELQCEAKRKESDEIARRIKERYG